MTAAALAWRPLTPREVRRRVRARIPGGPSLFDAVNGVVPPDTRTSAELEARHRLHLVQLDEDPDYRRLQELCVEVGHAHLVCRPDGTYDPEATFDFYQDLEEREEQARALGGVVIRPGAAPNPAAVNLLFDRIAQLLGVG